MAARHISVSTGVKTTWCWPSTTNRALMDRHWATDRLPQQFRDLQLSNVATHGGGSARLRYPLTSTISSGQNRARSSFVSVEGLGLDLGLYAVSRECSIGMLVEPDLCRSGMSGYLC